MATQLFFLLLFSVADPSVTTVYTVTGGNGCTDSMTVVVPDEACGPCKRLQDKPFHTIAATSSPLSSLIPGDNYYFASDVVVQNAAGTGSGGPRIVFDSNVIYMEKGIKVTVQQRAKLEMKHCHLFNSCYMWKGIVLTNATNLDGELYADNGTLIEDAVTGVSFSSNAATNIPTGYAPGADTAFIVDADGVIFNKDSAGIYLNNYRLGADADTANKTMPFRIRNAVFTCRAFNGYASGGLSYPFAWPTPENLKGNWSSGSQFVAPYNIGNGTYSATVCRNGIPTRYGVLLSSVNNLSTDSTHYWDVTIGDTANVDSNRYMNMFDNDSSGIRSFNSNFTVYNSVFAHDSSGIGNYVTQASNYRVQALGYTPVNANKFYNCNTGINVASTQASKDRFNFNGGLFVSNHDIANYSSGTTEGVSGIIMAPRSYRNIDIERNTFNNIKTGVSVILGSGTTLLGDMIVSNDTFDACPGCTSLGSTYLGQAIIVTGSTSTTATIAGALDVEHNQVNSVFNGIAINNFTRQQAIVRHNLISMLQRSGTTLNQYGIISTSDNGAVITNNTIVGTGADVPAQGSQNYGTLWKKLIGIDCNNNLVDASSNKTLVQCNYVDSINVGFQYEVTNNLIWRGNKMQANRYGYLLYTNGAIGSQMADSTASDNEWDGGVWDNNHPQTYTYNAYDTLSRLYLKSAGVYYPTFNKSIVAGFEYNTGNHSLNPLLSSTDTFICLDGYFRTTSGGSNNSNAPQNNSSTELYEQIVSGGAGYMVNVKPSRWIAQMAVWENLQIDPGLIDSSVILQQFNAMALSSRYHYLTTIRNAIASGNIQEAQSLLSQNIDALADTVTDSVIGVVMADDVAADYVVNNYRNYYKLYIKYLDGTMTANDSAAVNVLARLCPFGNGMVVYDARQLNYQLYGDNLQGLPDDCDFGTDNPAERTNNSNNGIPALPTIVKNNVAYKLYPNPSDGKIMIEQLEQIDGIAHAEILNAAGMSVYRGDLQFTNSKAQLMLKSLSQGLYLLQLTDDKGNSFSSKFVLQY